FLNAGVIADDRAFKHHRFAFDAGRRTNQRAPQFGSLTDVRVVPNDAAVHLRTLIDDSVVPNGAWPMNNGSRPDLAVVRQVDWPIQLGIFGNFNTLFAPDVAADVFRGNFNINASLQHISIGTHVFGQVANITPVAVGNTSINWIAFSQHHREKFLA